MIKIKKLIVKINNKAKYKKSSTGPISFSVSFNIINLANELEYIIFLK